VAGEGQCDVSAVPKSHLREAIGAKQLTHMKMIAQSEGECQFELSVFESLKLNVKGTLGTALFRPLAATSTCRSTGAGCGGKHYGRGRELRLFVGRDQAGAVVGLLPMFVETLWLGPLRLRWAKIVGCDFLPSALSPVLARTMRRRCCGR